jgi:hypothetical protein
VPVPAVSKAIRFVPLVAPVAKAASEAAASRTS